MPNIEGVLNYVRRCYRDVQKCRQEVDLQLGELFAPRPVPLALAASLTKLQRECEMLGSMRRLLGDLKALGPHGRIKVLASKAPGSPQDE